MPLEALSRFERQHQDAVMTHAAAKAKSDNIKTRVDDTAQRMATITQKRIDGNATDQETAEFAALQGDLELLKKMQVAAKDATQIAADTVHAAYVAHQEAENIQTRIQNEAEYQALLAKTREIEAVFCRAIRLTALAGKKIGHFTLSQSFQKSDVLHKAFDLGVIPEETTP